MLRKIECNKYLELLECIHIFKRRNYWFCFCNITYQVFILDEHEANILLRLQTKMNTKHDQLYSSIEGINILEKLKKMIGDFTINEISSLPINSFYLKFNNQCNMNCNYCYLTNSNSPVKEIDLNIALEAVKKMHILGAQGVGIHGGNPLMNFSKLKELIIGIRLINPEMKIGLTTNGTLINNEIATFLEKMNVIVSVEIDGGEKYIHDSLKNYKNGNSSFEDIYNGIKTLKKKKILGALEATFSNQHEISLDTFINSFNWEKNIPIVISRVKGKPLDSHKSKYIFYDKSLKNLLNKDIEIAKKNLYSNVFTDTKAYLINLYSKNNKNFSKYICSCILDKVSVDIDGEVYVCPKLHRKKLSLGNVCSDTFINEFNKNRLEKMQYFNKNKLKKYWFINLLEPCVDMLYQSFDRTWHIVDYKILEKYFEDLIYESINLNIHELKEMWENSGF